MSDNGNIANLKQVEGYKYNAKSLRDSKVTPKTVGLDYNGLQSTKEAQKFNKRNGEQSTKDAQSFNKRNSPFKASKKSFGSFIGN